MNKLVYLIALLFYSIMWYGVFSIKESIIFIINGLVLWLWLLILFIAVFSMPKKIRIALIIIPLLLIPVIYVFPWIVIAVFIVLMSYIDLLLLLRVLVKVGIYHLIGDNFGDMGTT